MITKLTKNPLISLLLSLIGLFLLGFKVYSSQIQANEFSGTPYSLVVVPATNSALLLTCTLLPLLILSCYLFIKLNSKYKFVEHSLAPFLFYFLIGLLIFPLGKLFLSVFIALCLCIVALRLLLSIHNQQSVMVEIFLASSLVSIASILFLPASVFTFLIISAVAILRSFRLKNYVLLIMALILPLFYLFAIDFIFELQLTFNYSEFTPINFSAISTQKSYIPFILLSSLALISFLSMFTTRSKFIVRQRNQLSIINIFTFLLIFISFFSGLSNVLPFLLLPFSLFFHYFHKNFPKKWIPEVALLVIYISSFLLNNI